MMLIDWIGENCPVEAEGVIGEKNFYFLARGDKWSLSVGGAAVVGKPEWHYEEKWGDGQFDAGWMPEHVALQMIGKAIGLYYSSLGDERKK